MLPKGHGYIMGIHACDMSKMFHACGPTCVGIETAEDMFMIVHVADFNMLLGMYQESHQWFVHYF